MALSLRRGTVSAITDERKDLIRLEVDGAPCIAYPRLTGPLEVGDDVIVNVQARALELGSGGFDVLYVNLTRGLNLPVEAGAHVMKLPYTPGQFAARHAEEGVELRERLEIPVVACSLHSQVSPVCAALGGRRAAYVQLAGGALPVSLSDTLRALRERRLLELTIGAGPCFGGDADCVNIHSALLVAQARGAEAVVCSVGPGVVGTGTALGHGGLAAAEAGTAALALGGRAVLAARLSEGDERERHRGISHHTSAVLAMAPGLERAWPAGCPIDGGAYREGATEVDVSDWREACKGLPLSHMGRGPDDDPWFFAAAFAAGRLVA